LSEVSASARLLAIGDLHVSHPDNRAIVEALRPLDADDWLIVCGDVSESIADFEWALSLLRERFATVIWAPGNHDLWTESGVQPVLRGEARYRRLLEVCRRLGVLTPEDDYAVWTGPGGPLTVAPLFLLYDYTFGRDGAATKDQALARAYQAGVVCSDELMLHPDPYPSREAWCRERVELTAARLERCDLEAPVAIVNHFPLVEAPTRDLRHPEFAQWCGTALTADWHRRFGAAVVVYGHLHVPRTTWHDGVRFEEVSLGYPHEWRRRGHIAAPRQVAPPAEALPHPLNWRSRQSTEIL
jgi:3',5'-cyclic AMP phosphodiesterase CpdA